MENKQSSPKGSRSDPPIASGSRGQPPWNVIGNVVKQSDGIKEVKQENEY